MCSSDYTELGVGVGSIWQQNMTLMVLIYEEEIPSFDLQF